MLAALVAAVAVPPADARPGGGRSSGSRGSQTQSAPPATATAPNTAQPMQRTQTNPSVGAPATAGMAGAPSRGLGFGGGLLAGMVGAGLLGALLGHGFMAGLGGVASFLGLLLQVALIGGLVWLAVRFFRRRREEPVPAGAGAPYERSALGGEPVSGGPAASGQPAAGGFASGYGAGGPMPARQPVEILQEDYAAFERSLCEVQLAYGRGDVSTLHRLATPEMVGYFQEDLDANRAQGVRNEVARPRLLQGDLAEAWREYGTDYATVAMRFEVVDATVELASGRVVAGDLNRPTEVTEVWTFRRQGVGNWMLSAIQQTA